jgi:DNA-binding CsgD family transcriptional regulator
MNHLRPVERRVSEMRREGVSVDEIAERLKRSPDFVDRMLGWIEIPRNGPASRTASEAMERRVLAMRSAGEDHDQIGRRFGRSGRFIKQVEGLAHYRKARRLLG